MLKSQNFIVVGLVVLAVFSRLLPHPPNFTPVMAIALFSGFHFQSKSIGLLAPLAALFISDLILGFYSVMWAVYLGFAVMILISSYLKKNKTLTTVMLTTLFGSLFFFMLTNFAVWLQASIYSKDWSGLSQCYVMALPFFRNSLLGDLVYTSSLFLIYEVAQRKILATHLERN